MDDHDVGWRYDRGGRLRRGKTLMLNRDSLLVERYRQRIDERLPRRSSDDPIENDAGGLLGCQIGKAG